MEPQAKRRRIDHEAANAGGRLSPNLAHVQPQTSSSGFLGTGVANNNGNFQIGRDLYVTTSNAASTTTDAVAKRRVKLLESLRFDQIDSRQLSITRQHGETCRWFLENRIYEQWETRAILQGGGRNFLWIRGKPGAGKSTLMNYLLGEVQSRLHKQNRSHNLVSFFFNARGNNLEKSTIGMYRSLLLQLLERRPGMQRVLDQATPGFQNDMGMLKKLFERVAERSTTICLIDALDECEVADIRKMVSWFDDITEAGIRISICFASRHYPHISIRTGLGVILEDQDEHGNDISSYINTKLDIGHSRQSEQIRREIREKASGVFMWVVLVVEILNTEYGKGKITKLRERLKQIPGDLHQLFHSILVRDDEDQDELLLCLQWVLFAKKPLTLHQLYLATNSGSFLQDLVDCHSEEITADDMKRYVVSSSKGLANTTRLGGKSTTIHFIHESVRDFLLKGDGMSRVFPSLATNISGFSHEALRKCCQTYIQMYHKLDHIALSRRSVAEQFPFLEYATEGVLYHADQAEGMGVSQGEFVASFPHSVWVKCYNISQVHESLRYTPNVSMLYILAQAGAISLIQALPHIQSCFETENEHFGLPIVAAAASKEYDCVQGMLQIQAKRFPDFSFAEFLSRLPPSLKDSHGPATPRPRVYYKGASEPTFVQLVRLGGELASLFYVATEGYDANSEASGGFSTLRDAVEYRYIHLLEELHRRGANMSAHGPSGDTLLYHAVHGCDPVVLKQLLDCGVDSSAVRRDGTSPLSLLLYEHRAAVDGVFDCVKLLIDHGADVSRADEKGNTPLHYALSKHGPESIKLLLGRGANVTTANNEGETPLHTWSSWSINPTPREEWIDIGRRLINRGADVAAVDENGQTPLHHSRSPETSQLLLDYNANISTKDSGGYTSLHLVAAEFSGSTTCQVLLRGGADVAAVDEMGRTPLHYCCRTDISELLLEHHASVSAVDFDGDTPLHAAASQGIPDMCELLLQYGANPAAVNDAWQTPLDNVKSLPEETPQRDQVVEILTTLR